MSPLWYRKGNLSRITLSYPKRNGEESVLPEVRWIPEC